MSESIDEKLARYRRLTKSALEKVMVVKGSEGQAEKLLVMARSYYSDAKFFEERGEKLTALAAYSYAHAWIDAGVKLGVLDGQGDDRLFTLP